MAGDFGAMHSSGFTLPEVVLFLLLIGVALQTALGPVRHQADLLTVRGVREELVALIHRARLEARSRGEAAIVLEEGADPLLVLSGGRPPARLPLTSRGVRLEVLGTRSSVRLDFGPLGIARFGSASLRLSKREARFRVVVSSYGRVRR